MVCPLSSPEAVAVEGRSVGVTVVGEGVVLVAPVVVVGTGDGLAEVGAAAAATVKVEVSETG